MPTVVRLDESVMRAIDQHLEKVAVINRSAALRAGLRGAANIVKNRTRGKLPVRPRDKNNKTPLRDTLAVRVYAFPSGKSVSLAGYEYKRGGQHGHLVEEGHRMLTRNKEKPKQGKTFVAGRHYLADADTETRAAQIAALEAGIKKALKQ